MQDPHGVVLKTLTMGGLAVETNGRDMLNEPRNPRAEARWNVAVEELIRWGFLEGRDIKGEVWSVTDQGYRVGDRLE